MLVERSLVEVGGGGLPTPASREYTKSGSCCYRPLAVAVTRYPLDRPWLKRARVSTYG